MKHLPQFKKPPDIPQKNWDIGLLFATVSIILLIALLCTFAYELQFILKATSTTGEVVALNSGRAHVEVAFKTLDGKPMAYSQNGMILYNLGEKVTVLYDPERPNRASTNAIGSLWIGTIFLSFFTAVTALISRASLNSKEDIFN